MKFKVGLGMVWLGTVGHGKVRFVQARLGRVWCGLVWVRFVGTRCGRFGWGVVWSGFNKQN
jgi:hypothetical protein